MDDHTRHPDDKPRDGILAAGQTFGQYKVIRLLGRGGMGEVYEVENPVLEKRYALKLLNKEIMERPDAAERFKREAKVMARFDHPNIVKVDDFGEIDGHAVLRMELIEGAAMGPSEGESGEYRSLADLLTGGPLPEALVVDLLKQILDGLNYAHEQGVVHRDLKPSNILLQPNSLGPKQPQPKITDFGLVRLAGEQWIQSQVQLTVARSMASSTGSRQADPDATRLDDGSSGSKGTSTQAMLGTFEFMAPEQKKGQEATTQSDLYAVGLMAFRMLTGQEQPGLDLPTEIVPGLDPAWDRWVKRAIAQDTDRRWDSANTMQSAIPWSKPEVDPAIKQEPCEEAEPESGWAPQVMEEASPDFGAESLETEAPTGPVPESAPVEGQTAPERVRSGFGKRMVTFVILLCLGGIAYVLVSKSGSSVNSGNISSSQSLIQKNQHDVVALPKSSQQVPEVGRDWVLDLGGGERLKLKWIGPGSFEMGSPSGESGRDDDERQHRVTLSKGYWLGEHEVTQGEWAALMGSNPSRVKGSNLPVETVSWEDAMSFCRKLTERERGAGRLPAGMSYTLPTEAQWEYACRAGTTGAYAGDLDAMGWYEKNSGGKTHPVGQKRANGLGLYDMHGNVWEWCLDWYGDYSGGSVVDPTGASSGSYRVLRGGGWYRDASLCRSANRIRLSPGFRDDFLGFRLALAPTR